MIADSSKLLRLVNYWCHSGVLEMNEGQEERVKSIREEREEVGEGMKGGNYS